LVLPVLYVDVPGLDENSDDDAFATVARIQWEDWRLLRLEDANFHGYRKGVNALAQRLVGITESVALRPVREPSDDPSKRLASVSVALSAEAGAADDGVDADQELAEPGLVDVLAETEEALPRWNETINELSSVMTTIGELTNEAAVGLTASDAAGRGFAGRLNVARQLAAALEEPASRLLDLASHYSAQLRTVDAGVNTLIDVAPETADSEEERESVRELFGGIREMAMTSRGNVEALKEFMRTLETTASFSRDLRPPLQRIREALQRILDGQVVMDEWVRQIDVALSALDQI
jgi:methyl-accepting chemotaxis protein